MTGLVTQGSGTVAASDQSNGTITINTPVATMGIRGTYPWAVVDAQSGIFGTRIDPRTGKAETYEVFDLRNGNMLCRVEREDQNCRITTEGGQVAVDVGRATPNEDTAEALLAQFVGVFGQVALQHAKDQRLLGIDVVGVERRHGHPAVVALWSDTDPQCLRALPVLESWPVDLRGW